MSKTVDCVVTFLEMTAEPRHTIPRPASFRLMLMRAERPTVGFYRFLYDAVGRNHNWIDRRKLSDSELEAIIHDVRVQVWVLYVSGAPAGYFEVDVRDHKDVELAYFGLIPEFVGCGLGKWFLSEAIAACWAGKPDRVRVETNTLDHLAALSLYQKLGFVPVGQKHKQAEALIL